MTASTRTRAFRLLGLASTLAITAALTVAPASAHEGHPAPKAGSTCAMSGMTETNAGRTYLCTSRGMGTTARWSRGLAISKAPLSLADGWAKAADTGMTAAFGIVKNPTSKPITVVGASSPVSAVVQLHEVVDKDGSMVMQQKAGGFVIPAGGMLELKPGGNHLMFMKVKKPIKAGDMVPITLITSDGALLKTKVMAKVYTGANESYSSGM